jgi:hypothetical protein
MEELGESRDKGVFLRACEVVKNKMAGGKMRKDEFF